MKTEQVWGGRGLGCTRTVQARVANEHFAVTSNKDEKREKRNSNLYKYFKQKKVDMTYPFEKDQRQNEFVHCSASIRDNIVELDSVRQHEDAGSYVQRCLSKLKTITNPDGSYFPQCAFLFLRLYRSGDVAVGRVHCAAEYVEHALRLASEAAIEAYDSFYPDVAADARAFVERSVETLKRFAADDVLPRVAVASGKPLPSEEFLPHLLNQGKTELEKTGEVQQKIGWLVHDGVQLFRIGAPPFEKPRFFKAVGEVARQVHAGGLVHLADGYVLDDKGKRTGEEMLWVTWVNPDATCVSLGAGYSRRKHPQLNHDIITFSSEDIGNTAPREGKQKLIPAWGIYHPN